MDARVAELFAGVGGFREGLQRSGWKIVWANQWEPKTKAQHAYDCYVKNYPDGLHSNVDIATVERAKIPEHDLLVGGFPCQDYSVATSQAQGIHGKKGVLWWEIKDILGKKAPPYLLLENVDRLLKSPTDQRGRDFGILLWCLQNFGYTAEWRVINAAEYGAPQKRRRTFIFASKTDSDLGSQMKASDPDMWMAESGIFASAFPVVSENLPLETGPSTRLPDTLQETSDRFAFEFSNSGFLRGRGIWSRPQVAVASTKTTLRSVLEQNVAEKYFIAKKDVAAWKYLKAAKSEPRTAKNGFVYNYTEGPLPFPDRLDTPSRTLLTTEGGSTPSRFRHIVLDPQVDRLRRLTPLECERLNQFPDNHTDTGMPENWRYFCMGNALVVGLVEKAGAEILTRLGGRKTRTVRRKASPVSTPPAKG